MPQNTGKGSSEGSQSRREFLQRIGAVGGVSAVYQAMVTMGLLLPGDAGAIESRQRWQVGASQLAQEDKPLVAVLGGGIAGLCIAYELKKAGFPFFLVEAQGRPGGRSHTVRNGSVISEVGSDQTCLFDAGEELYFNAGPARISHHHSNLLAYCRELEVALEPFVNDNRAAYIHSASAFAGQPKPAKQVIASMRGAIAELLAKAINAGALDTDIGFGERAAVLQVLRDYGDLSLSYQYNGSTRAGIAPGTGGLSPGAAEPALDWHEIFNHPDIPFIANFVEGYNQSATMLQPRGGMDRIAYALANQVQESAYYGVEVTAIRRTASGVRIEGRTPEVSGAAEADYAIVTIPPSVRRNIPNDFSSAARSAIGAVQYANPTKIAFQSDRFWEREDEIYGGISWTDPDILQMWYPSGGLGQAQGILVGSYLFGGSNASQFTNLTPQARIDLALNAGAEIHPSLAAHASRGISIAWSNVPYTLGGWAISSPSSILQAPDGPFLFAGDHLTYLRGWQEGAVVSGLNALANLTELIA